IVLLDSTDNRAPDAGPLAHLVYCQPGLAARCCERPADAHVFTSACDPVPVLDAATDLPDLVSIASMTPVQYGMAGIRGGISSVVSRTFPICNRPQPAFAVV